MDMLWCRGAQNIGLSNREVKSTLACTVWSQYHNARPSQTDDMNIMAILQRFVLWMHRALKKERRWIRKDTQLIASCEISLLAVHFHI